MVEQFVKINLVLGWFGPSKKKDMVFKNVSTLLWENNEGLIFNSEPAIYSQEKIQKEKIYYNLFQSDIKKRNHEYSNSRVHEFKVLHKGQRVY